MINAPLLSVFTPSQSGAALANRLRDLRLRQGWTRKTLAERSGVSLGSLERFERSGKVSLESLLKLAHALGRLHEIDGLLGAPAAQSLDDLERQRQIPVRKRGRV